MEVIIVNNQNKIEIEITKIKKCSEYAAAKFEKEPDSELNIIFTEKEDIRLLNKKYRNIDKPTDVLSFSYIQDRDVLGFDKDIDDFKEENGFFTIGEILICPEMASKNIKKKVSGGITAELVYLIIHGILHIYGYDHENDDDADKMESMQEQIFKEVKQNFDI